MGGAMVNEGQMIVISLVNSKGGVGKTTAALLLATGLSEAAMQHQQPLKAHITVLDADPNQPIQEWADTAGPSVLANMTVRGGVNENNIAEIINGLASEEETTGRGQIVIIDTQGAGNVVSSYAIMASDLVLVPVQASLLDGREAAKTIDLVAEMSEKRGSRIPCYAIWQRANAAIETRSAKNLREQFARLGVTFLETKLVDREPFRTFYREADTLLHLLELNPGDRSIIKARENALQFAYEVFEIVVGRKAAA
jgi:chromosome partitioning protein